MEAPDLEIKVYKTVLGSVLSLPVLGIRGWGYGCSTWARGDVGSGLGQELTASS